MQGVYIDGRRPRSKKEIKETLAELDGPERVVLQPTSVFGNEYGGPLTDAPQGDYTIVGPDPYTSREFYGTITVDATGRAGIK